jgi:hypothetical protein
MTSIEITKNSANGQAARQAGQIAVKGFIDSQLFQRPIIST